MLVCYHLLLLTIFKKSSHFYSRVPNEIYLGTDNLLCWKHHIKLYISLSTCLVAHLFTVRKMCQAKPARIHHASFRKRRWPCFESGRHNLTSSRWRFFQNWRAEKIYFETSNHQTKGLRSNNWRHTYNRFKVQAEMVQGSGSSRFKKFYSPNVTSHQEFAFHSLPHSSQKQNNTVKHPQNIRRPPPPPLTHSITCTQSTQAHTPTQTFPETFI